MLGVIESIHVVPCLSQQMCMTPLSAWDIENLRPDREAKHIHHAGNFVAIALESKNGFVLEQILGIEI
jgi:hypothetical protein